MSKNTEELPILGPNASKIKQAQDISISQGDGHADDYSPEQTAPESAQPAPLADVPEQDNQNPEPEAVANPLIEEEDIDPLFPFGSPDKIDLKELDQIGIPLLAEVNLRSWMKSVEYCSGHPSDRPADELSKWYPPASGIEVYSEIHKLDMAFIRGGITDVYYRSRKRALREEGATRFYLSVNVYDTKIFFAWCKTFSQILMIVTNQAINPLRVQYHPMRAGQNFSITWDYWTMEERTVIHELAIQTLQQFPV